MEHETHQRPQSSGGGGLTPDWTERDVLAEAEALVNLGAWAWEVEADRLWWSDETYRIFGLNPQEFPASYEGFLQGVHPDDRAFTDERVRQALAGDMEYDIDHRVLRPTGEVRHVHEHGRVTWDPGGKPVRMLGTVRDITAEVEVRKQRDEAVSALADSEQRYRLLAENAWDVVWMMDQAGTITYVSPAVQRVRGFTPAEAVAQRLDEIHTPESLAQVVDYFQDLHSAVAAGTELPTFHGQLEYYRKDGSLMLGELQVAPQVDQGGRLIQVLGVTRDISERQRYEAALTHEMQRAHSILDGMQDAWVMLQPVRDERRRIVDFVFAEVNVQACQYNRVSREEMLGASLLELLPGHRGSDLFASYVRVIETGEPLVLDDFVYPREIYGGAERRYDMRGTRVDEGMSFTWRDVTARYESRKRVDRSEQRLTAALESEIDPHVFCEAIRDEQGNVVDLRLVETNAAAETLLRADKAVLRNTRFSSLQSPAYREMLEAVAAVIDTGEPLIRDAWALDTSWGVGRYVAARAAKVGDGASVIWRDVTDSVNAQRALADSEERYRMLAMNASEMVLLIRENRVAWASPSALAFAGLDEEDTSDDIRTYLDPADTGVFAEACDAAEAGESRVIRLRMVVPGGGPYWIEMHVGPYIDAQGENRGILTSSRVIDDLIDIERELEHRAKYDLLTGLINRAEALETASRLLAHHPRTGGLIAMMYCDIDEFKEINDHHGHMAGDEVLRTVGDRLDRAIRADDFAARIGGDEFLVILLGVHGLEEAVTLAEKVHREATRPINISGALEIVPGLSIGVTLAHAGDTTDALLERADRAMYRAKGQGRNRVIAIR